MNSPLTDEAMSLHTEKKTLTVRGESFEVDYSYYIDEEGEHWVTPKMGDANLKQAWDQYNTKHGTNEGPFAVNKEDEKRKETRRRVLAELAAKARPGGCC